MKRKLLIIVILLNITNIYADRYIKIASINFEYIFNNYSATKLIKRKLKSIGAKIDKRVSKIERKIKLLVRTYNRNKHRYSEMERRWRFSEIRVKRAKLSSKKQYYSRRYRQIYRKYTINFYREIFLAAKKIAKKKGFSIVVKPYVFIKVDKKHNLNPYVLNYLEKKLKGTRRE